MWFAAPACQFSFLGGEESGVCKLLFKCLSGFEKQAAIYFGEKDSLKKKIDFQISHSEFKGNSLCVLNI